MKIRKGFVSNSSTSSFIVSKYNVHYVRNNLMHLMDFFNEYFEMDYKFDDLFNIFNIDDNYKTEMEDWGYIVPKDAKTIIESTDDNSIPHLMFELIEQKFNTTRNHLG